MVDQQVETYKNYVGGQWLDSNSGQTYTITSPAISLLIIVPPPRAALASCSTERMILLAKNGGKVLFRSPALTIWTGDESWEPRIPQHRPGRA